MVRSPVQAQGVGALERGKGLELKGHAFLLSGLPDAGLSLSFVVPWGRHEAQDSLFLSSQLRMLMLRPC